MTQPASESMGGPPSKAAAEAAPGRTSTRQIVAGAALALGGALGVFVPLASAAVIAQLVSHPGSALDALATVLASVPAVCLLALAAAVAVYRDARWARALGLAVAGLFAAALPVWILATMTLPIGDSGPVQIALWHIFFVVPLNPVSTAVVAVVGIAVGWALLTRAGPSRARVPARRPSFAMFLLVVIGVEAVVPYLSWLATNVLASPVAANGGPVHGAGPDVTAGLLLALPSAIASISALAAARAIRSRAPYGPYLAPAASAMAGPWSALWIVLIGFGRFGSADEASTEEPVRMAAQGVVIILAGLSALSFFVVTASVLRRRDWFLDRPRAVQLAGGVARSRPGRFWAVTGGVTAASLVPLVVATAFSIANPPPPQLYYSDVLFDGRAYRHSAPLDIAEAALVPAGSLSAWTEDLRISVARPDAFALPGVPIERALIVRGGVEGSELAFSVFVPSDSSGAVPPEVCKYIPIESPGLLVGPCLPMSVRLAGSTYDVVGDGGYVVVASDLDPLGTSVEAGVADPRVDLAANLVRGVPASEAIALRAGERILLYVASGRYVGGELCRYSPVAVADPLADEKVEVGDAPHGCLFPSNVVFDGRKYVRESTFGDILRVPTAALTALGKASALHPDFEIVEPGAAVPFPATVDATAHRIAGVDPETALAFRVGDRVVIVVHRLEGDVLLIPPALCTYVDSELAAEWEREKGEPHGCPMT